MSSENKLNDACLLIEAAKQELREKLVAALDTVISEWHEKHGYSALPVLDIHVQPENVYGGTPRKVKVTAGKMELYRVRTCRRFDPHLVV